jgi:Family of unknown function (DUF5996)
LTSPDWPALAFRDWEATCDTVHMWTQIVGKTRLALSPPENHWWHVPLYVTPLGLTTSPIPHGGLTFDVEFDFFTHNLRIRTSAGGRHTIPLYPRAVADFYAEYLACLRSLGIDLTIHTTPDEFDDPTPYNQDRRHASYDQQAVENFHRVLIACDRILKRFRGEFSGKSSPVHFFWGSFDLAVTRFSGRRAPVSSGTSRMMAEAYSHEVISCGFWPGDRRYPHAAFYAYALPAPADLDKQNVRPAGAYWDTNLREFLLKYDDVRAADSPEHAILEFCHSTYESAARLAGWDRAALERA